MTVSALGPRGPSPASHSVDRNALLPPRDWYSFAIRNAWLETERQYRRTILGPLWLIAMQAVIILGIGFVYTGVFHISAKDLMPFLSAGLITWILIQTCLSLAPGIFLSYGPTIQSFSVPISVFVFQSLGRVFIGFVHGLLIFAVVVALYDRPHWTFALAPLGIVLDLIALYPAMYILAVAGTRFRDLSPAMGAIVYILFLISPIIWRAKDISADRRFVVWLNPVYHMLEVVRAPLIGQIPDMNSYMAVGIGALVLWGLAFVVSRRFARLVVFWV